MANRRISPRGLVLAALTVVAAVVLVSIWPRTTADTTGSSPQGQSPQGAVPAVDPAIPPALGLERMEAERPAPSVRRDLFRFGAATPEPAAGQDPGTGQTPQRPGGGRRGTPIPQQPVEQLPVAPAPPPPIPLRVVGIAQTDRGAVVALSDGKSTFQGRVGEVVEGRWRIISIGVESVVIERVDGTGRQTLRGPG
jgi:hypothetical protein